MFLLTDLPSPFLLTRLDSPLLRHACSNRCTKMSYDDVEIEDMDWNQSLGAYTYPCPCGDLFQITKAELQLGEEIARCPSCSLYITVVYNPEDFQETKSKTRQAPPVKGPEKPLPSAISVA